MLVTIWVLHEYDLWREQKYDGEFVEKRRTVTVDLLYLNMRYIYHEAYVLTDINITAASTTVQNESTIVFQRSAL